MSHQWSSAVTILTLAVLAAGCSQPVSYSKDIVPIMEKNCLECHRAGGKGYEKSGLSMESHAAFMKGTKFGAVIEPGSSVTSTLVILIEHKADPTIDMPHGKAQLPGKDIELIKTWIDEGAKNN